MERELKISSVARESKEYHGKWSRGYKIEGNDNWFNIRRMEKDQVDAMFGPEGFQKGNKLNVDIDEMDDNVLKIVKVLEKGEGSRDDTTNLETLLNDAHNKNIEGIATQMLSHDPEKKSAVFRASVFMKDHLIPFEAHGDANQENIEDHVKKHYLRMAESRAISRALRWATNNASVSDEELGDSKGKSVSTESKNKPAVSKKTEDKAKAMAEKGFTKASDVQSPKGSMIDREMEKNGKA